jgi:hypothetical protein
MSRHLSIARVRREIHRMDPKLGPGSEEYLAAVTLLSSLQVGPNIKRLAKYMGQPRAKIAEFSRRLRANRVWRQGKVHCDWFGKHGGLEFWLDVGVAVGYMMRADK